MTRCITDYNQGVVYHYKPMRESLKRAQKKYRQKEDVKAMRREYDRQRDRAEYMREYRRRKKESTQVDDTATNS